MIYLLRWTFLFLPKYVLIFNPQLYYFFIQGDTGTKRKSQLAKSVISRNRTNGDLFQLRSRDRSIDCKKADQLSEKLWGIKLKLQIATSLKHSFGCIHLVMVTLFLCMHLAEEVRFELTEDFHPRQFSRLVHSTALPLFHFCGSKLDPSPRL